MKKKLAIAQPAVIDTELTPLTDSFSIEPYAPVAQGQTPVPGQLEQWYYENSGAFAPDRRVIPLTLTAVIKAVDTDTNIAYTPTFYLLKWFAREWNGTAWVRTEITNTTDSTSQPYVKETATNSLKIHKNVENASYPVTIECEAEYTDPRDAGTTIKVMDSVVLSVNQEATVQYPQLEVLNESTRSFNPLRNGSSQYDFNAKADWKGLNEGNGSLAFKADALGTEEITTAKTDTPASCAPILNIRYDKGNASVEQTDQKFTYRQTGGGLLPVISSGTGKIEKMKGNTVVWNQLLQSNRKYSHLESNGITWDVLTDGTVVANGRATALSEFVIYEDNGTTGFIGIVGHKYFSSILIDGATAGNNTYYARIIDNGGGIKNDWGLKTISTCTAAIGGGVKLRIISGNTVNNLRFLPLLFDLTLMFGAGNEPSTVAAFEQWLDANVGLKPYYPYDAGSLIPVKDTTLKTVGFNIWDEEVALGNGSGGTIIYNDSFKKICSKNFIPIIKGQTYYVKQPNNAIYFYIYDKNKQPLLNDFYTSISRSTTITFPDDAAYCKFQTNGYGDVYNHNICINLSDASKNGTYEPYWENTCPIDITTLKGRATGSTTDVVMFPDGLKFIKSMGTNASITDTWDEIDFKNGRAVKRILSVCPQKSDFFVITTNIFAVSVQGVKQWENYAAYGECCMSSKVQRSLRGDGYANMTDMSCGYLRSAGVLMVKDTRYTTVDDFWNEYSGIVFYAILNTPIEYTFDPIPQGQFEWYGVSNEWYGVSNGSEVKIDTLPAYVSGQNTDTLRIDALYSELITVVCRYRKYPWDEELIPQKEYRTVAWRVPELDVSVACNRGNTIRLGATGDYIFSTIVNMLGETLSDEVKEANLEFKWFLRKSNSAAAPTLLGWGLTWSVAASALINSRVNGNIPASMVFCEVYIKGALVAVTSNGVTTYQRQSNQ